MSWLADLAEKAEDFLNKMDQGAATALSQNQDRPPSFSATYGGELTVKPEQYSTSAAMIRHSCASSDNTPSYISATASSIKRSNATLLAGTANMTSISTGAGSNPPISAKVSSGFLRPKKEKDVDDDMLFNFLNSSDHPVSNRGDSKTAVLVTDPQIPAPPLSATPHITPSVQSTRPLTQGVCKASNVSSLSAHSIKTSEESSAKEQSQGMINLLIDVQYVYGNFLKYIYKLSGIYF